MFRTVAYCLLSFLALAPACGLPEDADLVDPEVHVARAGEDKADAVRIPFVFVSNPDFAVPTSKLQVERRQLFKTEASYRAFFGASAPRLDFTRNWAVFYTPGLPGLVRGAWATLGGIETTPAGTILKITTRLVTPGTCAPEATRPFALASFAIPRTLPKTTRYYKNDFARSCTAELAYHDGIGFTATEEAAALVAANAATKAELTAASITGSPQGILIAGRPWLHVSQVASKPGIGSVTMERLRVLAARFTGPRPPPPAPASEAGTYEGVAFTAEQAAAALRLCNEESSGVFTGEVGLDSRAAAGIIAARPLRTMAALAAASYVGPVAMGKLKDYVVARTNPARACRGDAMCTSGFRCTGIPTDGSSEEGVCRSTTSTPGGGDCTAARACAAGLVCAGLSRWETGNCVEAWMAARFENHTVRSITTAASATAPVVTSVVVTGLASVPVDVVVDLDLRHESPASLRVTLVDPNGDEGVVFDGPSARGAPLPTRAVVRSGISGDDQVNGRWLLKVVNVNGRGAGTLYSWTLDLTSRFD